MNFDGKLQMQNNEAQEEAIRTIDGPLLLVSCPGSGKTTTLVRRIHTMLESGIAPRSILMVTFTNAAAKDMQVKYEALFGENPGITFSDDPFAVLQSAARGGKIRGRGYPLGEGEPLFLSR